ncbi:PH domain-containing protein/ArfGap domain-containing protein/BAR domain-containing protein/Ank_2 domain-containing protein [Cephalotus follicularis]|uniref:PH domain-containing protein/ArfGap domain-containing protein/BAR domain-containing protein/Ank_2 domain-containing protein n=1 Tax=Cephalotus follicularis TaxID=3775 RepID=A0A1Q3AV00_CEPFO|nr:PH domain-containing protein/ArfGap domain-containing protein/BAR domain-containing protein/Ank_2 domain-containing protein [Cephalotus follicularis]
MGAFIKLDDSPMFQKQIFSLEQTADELKNRSQRLYKGCKKFMAALGEACNEDIAFADSLEAFGGGQDDPVSVSIGGPIISKFINAFRELATFKELLRSQVEHVLIDRMMHFMTVDLQDAKESRGRFDKAISAYDQAREKFVSLKKSTRGDIVAELEEDLHNSKSAFEKSRFNLVNALMNVERKKKHEFLESISAIMDAHLRYFKLGYDMLSHMEPFIHQVLTYAQQSKELANIEQDKLAKRIQEFRTQAELDSLRASSNIEPSARVDGIHVVSMSSYKKIEAIMQSAAANGEVQTIKQGYLFKRSSNLRGDWKRRFFVLDSLGTLYYYRNKGTDPMGSSHLYSGSAELNSGVFSRFRTRHNRSSSRNEECLGCHTIELRTSTIKMDADDTDLRLCFRIISPLKTYTLQAENGADRIDWVNKMRGVIASLLNSHFLQQRHPGEKYMENNDSSSGASASCGVPSLDSHSSSEDGMQINRTDFISLSTVLREIPGNDICAECSAPDPDWASLNLGILLCIECSGVHRNLGVHISKVRSLTLDVKVWEPTILDLFHALGNAYSNSIWEGRLLVENERVGESSAMVTSITKPCPKDAISQKEKYIHAKYVEKLLVIRDANVSCMPSCSTRIWQAVKAHNLREVYRLIVTSDTNILNTIFDDVSSVDFYNHIHDAQDDSHKMKRKEYDPAACQRIGDSNEPGNCLQGCSLLHLACHCDNPVMLELLLQFGADISMRDFHGRTPLHHCISTGNNQLAKLLLRKGAGPSIKDWGGLSALERAMEIGSITDEELFIMLAECR